MFKKPTEVRRKLVIVGDGSVGKTALFMVRANGYFPGEYEPTVFECYVDEFSVDGVKIELSLWDTAGQEEFDRLRTLCYDQTHVVFMAFSVDNPVSLENIQHKWIQEIHEYCPGVKIILLATKCDLREDRVINERLRRKGLHHVTYDEGLSVARAIGAARYLECSAKHNRGVKEAFEEAGKLAIRTRPKGSSLIGKRCVIL